jgi:folate-dependent phosphoribosylglycinamide formyltransferase PurN
MSVRAVVLTSTMLRHQFVANALAARLDVACVWQEEKSFEPLRYAETPDDEAEIARHFADRDASEATWFSADQQLRAPARRLPPGGCNDAAVIEGIRHARPDVVLVFGTGLLKRPILDAFAGRLLNIHLGLSPYYRGAGTNFWPLVNREPEFCGATIHFLDEGVDTGPIIAHVRPAIRSGDGPHDIGNRTIVAAADTLAEAAAAHAASPLSGVPQVGGGRVYARKDFSADAVRRLYANFAGGMIDEYLGDCAARNARAPLVSMETRAS